MKQFFLIFFSFLVVIKTNATDYYLSTGGSGNGTGIGGWNNAAPGASFLMGLIGTVVPSNTHIFIKAGTYNYNFFVIVPGTPDPPSTTYLSNDNILIQGGFPNTATGTDLSGYNPTANSVYFSYNAIATSSAFNAVLFKSNGTGILSNTVEIKGIRMNIVANRTITFFGGGNNDGGNYKFTDLELTQFNSASSLFDLSGLNQGSATFANCVFSGDISNGGPGVINGSSGIPFSIINCSFSNCFTGPLSPTSGGAISSSYSGNIFINNSSFCSNSYNTNLAIGGGAIGSKGSTTTWNISGCTFKGNSVYSGGGGAIYCNGGGLNISNCTFIGNSISVGSLGGGAVAVANSSGSISNCTFYANTCQNAAAIGNGSSDGSGGGAINLGYNTGNYSISNCEFVGNYVNTGTTGGALVLYNNQGANATIKNCLFKGNFIGTLAGNTNVNNDFAAVSAGGASGILSINSDTLQLSSQSSYTNYGGSLKTGYSFSGTNLFNNTIDHVGTPTYTCPTYAQALLLPITLINFTATKTNIGNLLQWTAENALNFSHFNVQRQNQNGYFETIGRISLTDAYHFIDANPTNGINYYRLEMVDIDGSKQYSKILSIANNVTNAAFGNIYPLPTKGNITIEMYANASGFVVYYIYDLTGKEIKQIKLPVYLGINFQQLSLVGLPNGIYLATAQTTLGINHIFKIVKE